MKWQNVAIDDLRGYHALKESLEGIAMQIEALTAKLEAIKGSPDLSQTRVQGGKRNSDDFKVDTIVQRDKLKKLLKANRLTVRFVERALAALTTDERLVLEILFISPSRGDVDYLSDEFHCGRSEVYRMRDAALKKFTMYLYGKG